MEGKLVKLTFSNGTTRTDTFNDGIIPSQKYMNDSTIVSVVIGDGITSIGSSAFFNCVNLTSVEILDTITHIGQSAFLNCSSLTSIEIPSGLTYINYEMFSDCTSLTSVTIPNTIQYVNAGAFYNVPTEGILYCDETWFDNLDEDSKTKLYNVANWTRNPKPQSLVTSGFIPQQYALNMGGDTSYSFGLSLMGVVVKDENLLVFLDGDTVSNKQVIDKKSRWNEYCKIKNYGFTPREDPQFGGVFVDIEVFPYNEVEPNEIYPVVIVRCYDDNGLYNDYYYSFGINNEEYTPLPRYTPTTGTSVGAITFFDTNKTVNWNETWTDIQYAMSDNILQGTLGIFSSESWADVYLTRPTRNEPIPRIIVEFDENTTYTRKTIITMQSFDVDGNFVNALCTLTQLGELGDEPTKSGELFATPKEITFLPEGSTERLYVETNDIIQDTLEFTKTVDWISVTKVDDVTYYLKASSNPSYSQREDTIVIEATDVSGNILKTTVNVKQVGNQYSPEPKDYSLMFLDDVVTVKDTTPVARLNWHHTGLYGEDGHIYFSGSTSEPWVRWYDLDAEVNLSARMVRFDKNYGGERSAIVSVSARTASDHSKIVVDTVKVVQLGLSKLVFNEKKITVDSSKGVVKNGFVIPDEYEVTDIETGAIFTEATLEGNTVIVNYDENYSNDSREENVTITYTDGSTDYTEYFTIIQQGSPVTYDFPIWKDTFYEYENNDVDFIDYKFKSNGEDIYIGRAYLINGKTRIKLNDILKSFINEDMYMAKNIKQRLVNNNGFVSAVLYISKDNWNTYETIARYNAYNNWSYDDSFNKCCLNVPILSVVDKRQYMLYSVVDMLDTETTLMNGISNSYLCHFYKNNGGISTIIFSPSALRRVPINSKFERYQEPWLKFFNSKDNEETVEYVPKETCYEYALYYQNLYGGWDYMLFNRASKQEDKLASNSYQRDYDNNTLEFGKTVYDRTITNTWTLKTKYLTDKQSKIFAKHLISAPRAFLHDLNDGEIYPVNVDTNSATHQTFFNNGKKLNKFSITVSNSQTKHTS